MSGTTATSVLLCSVDTNQVVKQRGAPRDVPRLHTYNFETTVSIVPCQMHVHTAGQCSPEHQCRH